VQSAHSSQWSDWYETPCFANVRRNHKQEELAAIQTKLIPTLSRDSPSFESSLTPKRVERYIDDVLDVCPGVVKRKDDYVFEYPLGNNTNYFRFLGVASLLRAVEEWYHWVDNYFEMKEEGIPRDVALVCMGLYDKKWAVPFCGHAIIGDLSSLQSLQNFNLRDAFLERTKNAKDGSSLWSLIQ
jgi:hypothetical protein